MNGSPSETTGSAAVHLPPTHDLPSLRDAARDCRGCELYRDATQVVFGDGAERARLMLVGEQPGDKEDLAGEPFVGPAGRLLDEALERADIDRAAVYVTNAVKHFRHEQRGKRRIHKKPTGGQIEACRPWLDVEIEVVEPALVIALGATAAQALLGRDFKVSTQRGELRQLPAGPLATATIHPSAILRARDRRSEEMDRFVQDLEDAVAAVPAS